MFLCLTFFYSYPRQSEVYDLSYNVIMFLVQTLNALQHYFIQLNFALRIPPVERQHYC